MTLRTGPTLTTLALLGGAVLALHLALLSGPLHAPSGLSAPAPGDAAAARPVQATAVPSAVRVTQVRQVAHVAATPVAAARPAPVSRSNQVAAAPPDRSPPPVAATPATTPTAPAPTPAATQPEPPEPAAMPAQPAGNEAPAQSVQLAQADAPTGTAPGPATPAPEAPRQTATETALPRSDLPPSITLTYDVTGEARGMNYRASGQLDWRHDAQGYDARMELSMLFLGSRVQTSRGGVGPEGLRPERFADRRSSERAAHFDREAGHIRFSNNAAPAPLMPGAQDRLSLFMQLAGLLRARPHQEGEAITFQVAGIGDAEPWRFEVGPLETLALPAGTLEARRLTRTPRKPHDSTVEVWLAPSLGHLPVRLRVAQANGDVADQRLARLP